MIHAHLFSECCRERGRGICPLLLATALRGEEGRRRVGREERGTAERAGNSPIHLQGFPSLLLALCFAFCGRLPACCMHMLLQLLPELVAHTDQIAAAVPRGKERLFPSEEDPAASPVCPSRSAPLPLNFLLPHYV